MERYNTGDEVITCTMFNNFYDDFIKKIGEYFPENNKIEFYRGLFHEIKNVNQSYPPLLFLSSVGPHSEHIFNKNDGYFLDKKGFMVTKTEKRAVIEDAIRNGWNTLSESQRDIIWEYLQRLLLIVSELELDNSNITIEERTKDFSIDKKVSEHITFK